MIVSPISAIDKAATLIDCSIVLLEVSNIHTRFVLQPATIDSLSFSATDVTLNKLIKFE